MGDTYDAFAVGSYPKQSCVSEAKKPGPGPNPPLDEKVSLIALSGIGSWSSENSIDALQKEGFRAFHIYGNHDFKSMKKFQSTLEDPAHPPYIVTIDQEGGIVSRFNWAENFKYIYPNHLVSTGDPSLAKKAGYITGQMLKLYGINLNFAPFLDLNSYWPGRGFSDKPEEIGKYGSAFMEGLLEAGVGACAKHFPDGAPRSEGDPHKKVVKIYLSREELFIRERFQPLIDRGVPAIMMSHVVFPKVDPDNPASLSKMWITNILRNEMGFRGLVITDALEMKAISNSGLSLEESILKAFMAGADIILAPPETVKKVLMAAAKSGKISTERIDESVNRILAFNKRFPINHPPGLTESSVLKEAEKLHAEIESAIKSKR